MNLRALALLLILPTSALAGASAAPPAGSPLGLVLGVSGAVTLDVDIDPVSML